jgi:hypothetical protein
MHNTLASAFAAAAALLAASPAAAREAEPNQVKAARDVKAGHGVVILSLRSQDQLFGKLSVWFAADDDTARRSGADHVKFERKQGVPLAGYNMVDLKPSAFSVPAGKWRLLAHTVRCGQLPPPDTTCVVTGANSGIYPTGRYDGSSVLLDVQPGSVLDAGDLILEFPAGTEVRGKVKMKRQRTMRLRWKPLPEARAAAIVAPFAGLPVRRLDGVSPEESSQIRCANDKAKINSGLSMPWDC